MFSVTALEGLLREGHSVVAVYTRPDKPAGRGQRLISTPVKKLATERNIPVIQPVTLKSEAVVHVLEELKADLFIVAAYGRILPKTVLSLPVHGCLNIHPSLLPCYRGASPVAFALLGGEQVSGVTIMLMDEGMDSGPILAQQKVDISADDTTGSLTDKLARVGAELLLETLPKWLSGEIKPQAQDNSQATYSRIINAGDGEIDWHLEAVEICRRIRAYNPWPGAYSWWRSKRLKIYSGTPFNMKTNSQPGEVITLCENRAVGVVTGEGYLELCHLQLEGKQQMTAIEFARGHREFIGSVLG